jgi:hypothetical protein
MSRLAAKDSRRSLAWSCRLIRSLSPAIPLARYWVRELLVSGFRIGETERMSSADAAGTPSNHPA